MALSLTATAAFAEGTSPAPSPVALVTPLYTQNFDTLATTGASSFLPVGWQLFEGGIATAADGSYVAGTGTATAGGAYSFGAAGSTDRALGSIGSGTATPIRYGGFFTNALGSTITSFVVSYNGEQWRSSNSPDDFLAFEYSTSATDIGSGTWTSVAALNFSTIVIGTATGAPLDGNTNFITKSATITGLTIADGGSFAIRWTDVNSTNNDQGLAIDNVSLTAGVAAAVVPEAGTWAMMVVGFGLLGAALRRRRVQAFA